jgi:hypothetical protein
MVVGTLKPDRGLVAVAVSLSSMSIPHQVIRLQVRIETVAENHSVPGRAGVSLNDTLAGLDLIGRRRVTMMLEMIKAFSDDPDEKSAAEHIQMRAARAWYGTSVSFASDMDGDQSDIGRVVQR